jgi:hypothetical protein
MDILISKRSTWIAVDLQTPHITKKEEIYIYIYMNRRLFWFFFGEAIGTAATPGLLCQPRVIVKMIVEKHMECKLAGETEVLGKPLPQRHFCPSQNPT